MDKIEALVNLAYSLTNDDDYVCELIHELPEGNDWCEYNCRGTLKGDCIRKYAELKEKYPKW